MTPSQADIILVPVPFTDLTSSQRRPVIVISNDAYNQTSEDFVCVALTSNLAPSPYGFVITTADLAEGTLKRPSKVRVDKVYTLAQKIAVKRFGRVNTATLDRIRQLLTDLCR
jgi:mRNA-degrading endonuclease toxin of MazEF toxin-antitoxin module